MSTGIDTYGMGRCPFYFEPAVLITITDGGKLFYQGRVQERLILPQEPQLPGEEVAWCLSSKYLPLAGRCL